MFSCDRCDKVYTHARSLRCHGRNAHDGVRYACTKCDAVYTKKIRLVEHVRRSHPPPKTTTESTSPLASATSSESVGAPEPTLPVSRGPPVRMVDYDNDSSENSPPRGRAVRIVKYDDDSDSSEDSVEEVQEGGGYVDLEELRRVYDRLITPRTDVNEIEHRHVLKMTEPSLVPLEAEIRAIFAGEKHTFRLNGSFNYVLRHRTTNRYRFYYGSHGEKVLFVPAEWVDPRSPDRAVERLLDLDVMEFVTDGYEDSAWVFETFTNLNLYVYPLEVSVPCLYRSIFLN